MEMVMRPHKEYIKAATTRGQMKIPSPHLSDTRVSFSRAGWKSWARTLAWKHQIAAIPFSSCPCCPLWLLDEIGSLLRLPSTDSSDDATMYAEADKLSFQMILLARLTNIHLDSNRSSHLPAQSFSRVISLVCIFFPAETDLPWCYNRYDILCTICQESRKWKSDRWQSHLPTA